MPCTVTIRRIGAATYWNFDKTVLHFEHHIIHMSALRDMATRMIPRTEELAEKLCYQNDLEFQSGRTILLKRLFDVYS